MRPGLADEGDQPLRRAGPEVVGDQVEGEGPHVVGLGVRRECAVGADELGTPGLEHVRGQVLETGGLGIVAEQPADVAGQRGGVAQERSTD